MTKINENIYDRMVLQANEANELGLTKLAERVLNSLDNSENESPDSYSLQELKKDVYSHVWKIAMNVLTYHDMVGADIQKVDEIVQDLTNKVVNSMEKSLDLEHKVGALEPKLPGENK